MEYARLIKDYRRSGTDLQEKKNKEEVTAKDQELNSKIEEILSLMKDMSGKSKLSRSEPRYEEMLSFMKELREKLWNKRCKKAQKLCKKKSLGQEKAERRARKTRGR